MVWDTGVLGDPHKRDKRLDEICLHGFKKDLGDGGAG